MDGWTRIDPETLHRLANGLAGMLNNVELAEMLLDEPDLGDVRGEMGTALAHARTAGHELAVLVRNLHP